MLPTVWKTVLKVLRLNAILIAHSAKQHTEQSFALSGIYREGEQADVF